MGFLSRKKEKEEKVAPDPRDNFTKDLLPKLNDLRKKVAGLALDLEKLDKAIKALPNSSDYRLLASEIARLQDELERMEEKHKEGMLAMYAQIHKEIRSIRGDKVIQMIDVEPVTEEKLEEASDQLSELARTWRKRRVQPSPDRE